ncbi:hypothetical protein CSHISOI_07550 [Colletotrichum shisoi]|uniref:Uncharacterized protein n=1 Tax=Colletotrichum shisoi TaxID=2078593 RepID=A0A5Q4BN64_9PEZI|nr:hypothetical protein CSHISOI_07550 [Colletotrichum shisoi]
MSFNEWGQYHDSSVFHNKRKPQPKVVQHQIKPFASAIKTYFTEPSAPFSAAGISSWDGTDVFSIGDVVFSQRFSQLLNTFWLASVASRNVTGSFIFHDEFDDGTYRIITQNATGTRTPDLLVVRVSGAWLSVLFVASVTMLATGIFAAILGCRRRGPDVLDYPTFFFRDSRYVHMPPGNYRSMEDAM